MAHSPKKKRLSDIFAVFGIPKPRNPFIVQNGGYYEVVRMRSAQCVRPGCAIVLYRP